MYFLSISAKSEFVYKSAKRLIVALCCLPIAACGVFSGLGSEGSDSESTPDQYYLGAAVSFSNLEPDTSDSAVFSLDDSSDTGFALTFGRDFTTRISGEIRYGELGEATLSPAATVDYAFIGVSGLYYVFGDEYLINRREGFAVFLRGGINSLMNDASIALDDEDNVQIVAGVGIDYRFNNNWGVRGELDFHDTDAQAAHIGIVYRFGESADDKPVRVSQPAPTPEPVRSPTPPQRPVPEVNTPDVTPAPVSRPQVQEFPQPVPDPLPVPVPVPVPVPEPEQRLPQPQIQPGPSLLVDGILRGVRFSPSSALLDAVARRELDQLVNELKQNPDVTIELLAHTDRARGPDFALQLARARVTQVGRYIIDRGVSPTRVKARAFGSNRPLSNDPTAQVNNRIELVIGNL